MEWFRHGPSAEGEGNEEKEEGGTGLGPEACLHWETGTLHCRKDMLALMSNAVCSAVQEQVCVHACMASHTPRRMVLLGPLGSNFHSLRLGRIEPY